ncbi:MAG: hypothetical protein JSV49_09875 [Thermoplasmata archaeon]|nr:MAG: hypothetical protein JSV49_09875 [Thermoplasmata archaeon]
MTETTNILTLENLTRAIQNSMGLKGIDKSEAKRRAEHILNVFGYSDRLIDNVLEPEDRDLFYMMEDSGLLTTEREETTLYDGREWRINYWLFKKSRIQELINLSKDEEENEDNDESVYDDIPEDVWSRDSD